MSITTGPAQMVNWETKRAAVEKEDRIDLYRLLQTGDNEAVAKHVGAVLTLPEAELWLKGKAELDIEK